VEAHPYSGSDLDHRLTVAAVLGLHSSADPAWPRLRQLQYGELKGFGVRRAIVHVTAAAAAGILLAGTIELAVMLVWGALLIAGLYQGWALEKGFSDFSQRAMRRGELLRYTAISAILAILWAGLLIHAALTAPIIDLLALIGVTAIVVTSSALTLSAPPLGTVVLIAITTIGGTAAMTLAGRPDLGILPLLYAMTSIYGTVEKSRAFLSARIAQAGMQEKAEVVSLLLREHEESSADWLWEIDTRRRLRAVSPRFAYALGRTPAEANGKPFVELLAGEDWSAGSLNHSLHDLAERLKRKESFSALLVEVRVGGQKRSWELSGTPLRDEQQRYIGFRGVGSDVTEQREYSEKISFLARYDTLTALPNRLQLHERLSEALRYSAQWRGKCAFMMLDLDRFKAVNDTLGHLLGDQLLAEVAKRLQRLCGEQAICGRLGGDEFGIVIRELPGMPFLNGLARNIINSLTDPFQIDGNTLYIGTSVGSAVGPRDGDTVEELMRNADLALYEAKANGGGEHCVYQPSLHAAAEEQRRIEIALRHALEREELHLQYQPIVHATHEHIVSFEALVRWQSSEHGPVSPAKFIPIAEDTRLIVPIGEWVLRTACLQATEWPDSTMVNVNVSPAQLLQPSFVQLVAEVLSETGLPARRLEIEVTESVFLADANVARQTLEGILELGCSVALDDFGTGYSSLGYLRTLRFSTIKVDRLFVKGASQGNRESLAIINAVVAMSESLGMTTTAEGVETAEEAQLIRAMGCTKIQGFHFGRPMPADQALELVQARKAAGFDDAAFARKVISAGHN
jgi:diguanylate cyclase (GGDEF)-like protein/PAS domain S-box-containing protein